MKTIFMFCFILLWCNCYSQQYDGISKILVALKRIIRYMRSVVDNINLDGLFGLRVLEGELRKILKEAQTTSLGLPKELQQEISDAYADVRQLCIQALPYVEQDYPEYYLKLHALVDEPIEVGHVSYKLIDEKLKWTLPNAKAKGITETISDQCMSEVLGTAHINMTGDSAESSDHAPPPAHTETQRTHQCEITTDCLMWMLTPGKGDYHITHQLLYTTLLNKHNCTDIVVQYLRDQNIADTIEDFQLLLCTNVYHEMQANVKLFPIILPIYRDLFMEQLYVCPSMGYIQFLELKFLKQVLSWQHENGCFLEKVSEAKKQAVAYYNNLQYHKNGEQPSGTERKLLLDKEMQDGCLLHMTAVALGCLSQYLRFYVQSLYHSQFKGELDRMQLNHSLYLPSLYVQPVSPASRMKQSDSGLSDEANDYLLHDADFSAEHENTSHELLYKNPRGNSAHQDSIELPRYKKSPSFSTSPQHSLWIYLMFCACFALVIFFLRRFVRTRRFLIRHGVL